MDELEKGLSIAMTGKPRAAALAAFRRQVRKWGVALPPVAPLVLDFGLGEFRKTGLIEYWLANEQAAGYCGKYLFVFAGQTCPRHRHRTKHETFLVVKGRARMRCGRSVRDMKAGDVLPVPPGVFHSFTGQTPALLLELSMPCRIDDNEFSDRRIPIGRPSPRQSGRRFRAGRPAV